MESNYDYVSVLADDYICLIKTTSLEKAVKMAHKYEGYSLSTFVKGEMNNDVCISAVDVKIEAREENQFGLDVTVYYVLVKFNITIG